MCEFFSCIVTKDGRILFTEQDSHREIVRRAKLTDDEGVVFLEVLPPFDAAKIDGPDPVPGWFLQDREQIEARALTLARTVAPDREQYDAVEREAMDQYDAVRREAMDQYDAVRREAMEQYVAVRREAWEQYDAVEREAMEQYVAVRREAWEQYVAVRREAREQYEATISEIEGYCRLV